MESLNLEHNGNQTIILDLVEQVPIFPGCEKLSTNGERKACMSEKISKLVQRKFNTNIGDEQILQLSLGIVKFSPHSGQKSSTSDPSGIFMPSIILSKLP